MFLASEQVHLFNSRGEYGAVLGRGVSEGAGGVVG